MYLHIPKNSKKWNFHSVKILKYETFLIASEEILKSGPFYA